MKWDLDYLYLVFKQISERTRQTLTGQSWEEWQDFRARRALEELANAPSVEGYFEPDEEDEEE